MRLKLILITLILLTCGLSASAQFNQKATLTASSTDCSVAASCLSSVIDQVVTNAGGATLTVSTNASGNTIQFEASGDSGITWVALSAYPSNSTTAASSTTSTGTWQANVAGYT